ncbi:MAG TPA: phosphoglucosamine mutase [Candidatus Polarisedimenticolia bacterium]|jgi:phosphoglucosamine mutase|nr:phosphoglucosamine mutase [Candidatus Polarisedimenticolia bacterium]
MKRLFGTDGVRGVAGEFPLDDATVERLGAALAAVLGRDGHAPRILIGRDTRASGPAIEAALERGIAARGGRTDRGGVLTTPGVACVTRTLGYDAGVVVSASHNPYRDNGIKIFSRDGFKLPDAVEMEIERLTLDGGTPAARGPVADATATPESPASLARRYLDWLRLSVPPATSFKGRRIVLDCAHGAASELAPRLFESLGAEVITLHAAPDGRNINEDCGALHPETLAKEVARQKAFLGLAFDGDADRCLPVDARGRILDGDYVLYLMARDLKKAGRLKGDAIVGTVMTNLWLERSLKDDGVRVARAPVGDKYVLEEMQKDDLVLGGEQSGHVIFLERATTGDGVLTGLLLSEYLQRTGFDLAGWAETVRPCPQVLVNVKVKSRPPLAEHPVIGPAIVEEERRLAGRGRVLVRYSGTEPKARIMVEGEPRAAVEDAVARLKAVIEKEIGDA